MKSSENMGKHVKTAENMGKHVETWETGENMGSHVSWPAHKQCLTGSNSFCNSTKRRPEMIVLGQDERGENSENCSKSVTRTDGSLEGITRASPRL